jgi:hypothetical protein
MLVFGLGVTKSTLLNVCPSDWIRLLPVSGSKRTDDGDFVNSKIYVYKFIDILRKLGFSHENTEHKDVAFLISIFEY